MYEKKEQDWVILLDQWDLIKKLQNEDINLIKAIVSIANTDGGYIGKEFQKTDEVTAINDLLYRLVDIEESGNGVVIQDKIPTDFLMACVSIATMYDKFQYWNDKRREIEKLCKDILATNWEEECDLSEQISADDWNCWKGLATLNHSDNLYKLAKETRNNIETLTIAEMNEILESSYDNVEYFEKDMQLSENLETLIGGNHLKLAFEYACELMAEDYDNSDIWEVSNYGE